MNLKDVSSTHQDWAYLSSTVLQGRYADEKTLASHNLTAVGTRTMKYFFTGGMSDKGVVKDDKLFSLSKAAVRNIRKLFDKNFFFLSESEKETRYRQKVREEFRKRILKISSRQVRSVGEEEDVIRFIFQHMLENTSAGAFVVDYQGNILWCNSSLKIILGYVNEDLIGKSFRDHVDESSFPDLIGFFSNLYRGEEHRKTVDYMIHRKDDEAEVYVSASIELLLYKGVRAGFFGIAHDVTEKRKLEIEFKKENKLNEGIINHSRQGIIVLGKDGIIENVNKTILKLLGYSAEEENIVIGRSGYDLILPEYRALIREKIHKGYSNAYEVGLILKNGKTNYFDLIGQSLTDDQGEITHALLYIDDLTGKRDRLTGLPGTSTFITLLGQALKEARRNKNKIAVIYLDFNNLKEINDNHPKKHQAGDLLLKGAIEIIKKHVRWEDIIARKNEQGDEYCMYFNFNERSDLEKRLSDIMSDLDRSFIPVPDSFPIKPSAAFGVEIYSPDDIEINGYSDDVVDEIYANKIEELINNADNAMYIVKGIAKSKKTSEGFIPNLFAFFEKPQ